MKRVAAGAHLPTPWLFEPAKRPDDRADNFLDCNLSVDLTVSSRGCQLPRIGKCMEVGWDAVYVTNLQHIRPSITSLDGTRMSACRSTVSTQCSALASFPMSSSASDTASRLQHIPVSIMLECLSISSRGCCVAHISQDKDGLISHSPRFS